MIKLLCKLLEKLTVKGTVIYERRGKFEKIKW